MKTHFIGQTGCLSTCFNLPLSYKTFLQATLLLFLFLMMQPAISYAGFWDSVTKVLKPVGEAVNKNAGTNSLSSEEIIKGLIEALNIGSEKAVNIASAEGGFLNNSNLRIPLPEKLDTVGKTLRKFGLGSKVDSFETTLNTAAEKASIEALPIIKDTIKTLSIEDGMRLLKGGDTAITEYFQENTRKPIYDKYKPIIHSTSQSVGVTQSYQNLINIPAVKTLTKGSDLDLDHYVTEKALDGLFFLIAEEEKQIRANPVARTTELLKKVFAN